MSSDENKVALTNENYNFDMSSQMAFGKYCRMKVGWKYFLTCDIFLKI